MRCKSFIVSLIAAATTLSLAACSSGGNDTKATAPPTTAGPWDAYNATRTDYDAKANAIAKSVADRINRGGVRCSSFGGYSFAAIEESYRRQHLPLALGAGQCDAAENVLIEVFGTSPPTAADFVAAKRALICQRARDLGRKPNGSSDFDGIPYVMAPDKTWIAEPDSFTGAKRVARALGLKAEDMCAGIR